MEDELKKINKSRPALSLLLSDRINRFFKVAAHELEVTHRRIRAVHDKYVQKDEQGNLLIEVDGDKRNWKFIECGPDLHKAGVLDISLVEKSFTRECEAIGKQMIQLNW